MGNKNVHQLKEQTSGGQPDRKKPERSRLFFECEGLKKNIRGAGAIACIATVCLTAIAPAGTRNRDLSPTGNVTAATQPERIGVKTMSFQAETLAVASTFASDDEKVQLLCLYPQDVPECDVAAVKRAGQGMNKFAGHKDHGAEGFGIRFNTNSSDPNDLSVISVQLGAAAASIIERGKLPAASSDSMLNFIENQVYEKVEKNPLTAYMAVLTGVPPFGRAGGIDCVPGLYWGGVRNGRISTGYSNSYCDNPDRESYKGFRMFDIRAAQALVRNEGFLWQTNCGYRDDGIITSPANMFGLSNKPNDLLAPNLDDGNWNTVIGRAYLQREGNNTNPDCPYLAENPRWNWLVNAKTNGAGLVEFYQKQPDGAFTQIALDPGNRLQAGKTVRARYEPKGKEVFDGWRGDCTGPTCEFVVDEVIDIEANVKKEAPAPPLPTPEPKPAPKAKEPAPEYRLIAKTVGPDHGGFRLGKLVNGEVVITGKLRERIDWTAKRRGQVLVELVADPGYYAKKISGEEHKGDPRKSKLPADVVPVILDGRGDVVTVSWARRKAPVTK